MEAIEIFFESTDGDLIDAASEFCRENGIEVTEWMLKAGKFKSVSIFIASTVALNLVSSWIYDKVKNQRDQETVINGNQIKAQNVTIKQLNQVFCGNHSNKNDDQPKQ